MKRRFLSILFVMVLLLSLLPVSAMAVAVKEVSYISAETPDGDITPVYGAKMAYIELTITEGDPAHISGSMCHWFKWDGNTWKQQNRDANFTEGTYRYSVQIRIDGDDAVTHKLDKDGVTVMVDGKAWETEYLSVYDTYSYVFANSPSFEVVASGDVIIEPADEVEISNIPLPIGGDTADSFYLAGEPETSDERVWLYDGWLTLDSSFEGRGEPFEGTFEAGKTYYLFLDLRCEDGFAEDCAVTTTVGQIVDTKLFEESSLGVLIALKAVSNEIDSLAISNLYLPVSGWTVEDYFASIPEPEIADPRVELGLGMFVTNTVLDKSQPLNEFEGTFEAGKTYYLLLVYESRAAFAENCGATVSLGQVADTMLDNGQLGVLIKMTVPEIFVGGKGMVSGQYLSNSGKLSTTKPSGGYAYYKDGTLTLSSFNYEGEGTFNADGAECYDIINASHDLVIVLKGKNTLTCTAEESGYGITVYGTLTIKADAGGSMAVTASNTGLYAEGVFTVESGDISAVGEYNGIYIYGDVTVNGGSLLTKATKTSDACAMYVDGEISVNESTHTITASEKSSGTPTVTFDKAKLDDYHYVRIAPITYTVSFAANGGAGNMTAVDAPMGSYTLPANGFTAPEGHQFKAWSVDGAEKAPGSKITLSADVTLTAVWEKIPENQPTTQPTTAPTDPSDPTNPSDPTDPTNPTDPTSPTDPSVPTTQPTTGNAGGEGDATPAPTTPSGGDGNNSEGSSLLWLWIVIAVAAVGGIVIVILISKKKKAE